MVKEWWPKKVSTSIVSVAIKILQFVVCLNTLNPYDSVESSDPVPTDIRVLVEIFSLCFFFVESQHLENVLRDVTDK